jgi:Xaa-Pro aminopeptidase
MALLRNDPGLRTALRQRRARLAEHFLRPVVFWSGKALGRNYPANTYPFRANSHFLYFAGLPLEDAAIRIEGGRLELYFDEGGATHALWHGETPTRAQLAEAIGADDAYPLAELASHVAGAATLPLIDARAQAHQAQMLGRPVALTGIDRDLAEAVIALRLIHDDAAVASVREAAATSVAAHRAAMAATPKARRESEVRAALEAVFTAADVAPAYGSIVTVHGEVLHNEAYRNPLAPADLLLADAGAESSLGWASDVTRTWPVSGKFSPTQRDIYAVVLQAHDWAIATMAPGVEYQEVHLTACLTLAEGLVDLGILRGNPADLVEADAHALFFPHGIGHLLGLDVHDMEDLGDLAGYAPGRSRSPRFGLGYLRLNRPLAAGMITTIEPGFYQVPALLNDPGLRERYREMVDWERLARFADVRGIRIEDDVLVTERGTEVLTAALPTAPEAVEALVRG